MNKKTRFVNIASV